MSEAKFRLAYRLRQAAAVAALVTAGTLCGGVEAAGVLNGETVSIVKQQPDAVSIARVAGVALVVDVRTTSE